jgi:hypothetical protein
MLIDRKAKHWVLACLAILIVATVCYIPYHRHAFGSISGGSWPGLAFGAAGSAAMLVSMALAARKKIRSIQMGRVSYWMQAHVWFGFLSYPLIIYHAAGFAWGGPLTQTLMWLFSAVMISGIIGLLLQQIVPTRLMRSAPAETIYEQIDHVLVKIREEADAIARPILAQQSEPTASKHAHADASVATLPATDAAAITFVTFYSQQIVPFLAVSFRSRSPFARESSAETAFNQWRTQLSQTLEPLANGLQKLVNERRDLHRQRRLHRWLHGWLLIHVPLSYLLIVLGTIHAVLAFHFTSPMH